MSGRRRFISPKWFHRPTRLCFRAFDAMKLMTSGASPIAQMSGAVFSATPPTPRWPRPSASAARAAPDHRLRDDHRSMLEVPASNDELKALLNVRNKDREVAEPAANVIHTLADPISSQRLHFALHRVIGQVSGKFISYGFCSFF
jgi:hypothetical protein